MRIFIYFSSKPIETRILQPRDLERRCYWNSRGNSLHHNRNYRRYLLLCTQNRWAMRMNMSNYCNYTSNCRWLMKFRSFFFTGIIFYVCERSRRKPVDEEDAKLGRWVAIFNQLFIIHTRYFPFLKFSYFSIFTITLTDILLYNYGTDDTHEHAYIRKHYALARLFHGVIQIFYILFRNYNICFIIMNLIRALFFNRITVVLNLGSLFENPGIFSYLQIFNGIFKL